MDNIFKDILCLHPNIDEYINEAQKTSEQYDKIINELYGYNEVSKAQQAREDKVKKQTLKAKEKETKATDAASKFLTGDDWDTLRGRAISPESKVVDKETKQKFIKKDKKIKQKNITKVSNQYDLDTKQQELLNKKANDPNNKKKVEDIAKEITGKDDIPPVRDNRDPQTTEQKKSEAERSAREFTNDQLKKNNVNFNLFDKLFFEKILEMISALKIKKLDMKNIEYAFDELQIDKNKKNIFANKIKEAYKTVTDEQIDNIWNSMTDTKNDTKAIGKFIAMPDENIQNILSNVDQKLIEDAVKNIPDFKEQIFDVFHIDNPENFEIFFNNLEKEVQNDDEKNISIPEIYTTLLEEQNGLMFKSIHKVLQKTAVGIDKTIEEVIAPIGTKNSTEKNKILDARRETIWVFLLWATINTINLCINKTEEDVAAENAEAVESNKLSRITRTKKTKKQPPKGINITNAELYQYIDPSIKKYFEDIYYNEETYNEGPIAWAKSVFREHYQILTFKDLTADYNVFLNYIKNIFTNNETLDQVVNTVTQRVSNMRALYLSDIKKYGIDLSRLPTAISAITSSLTNPSWVKAVISKVFSAHNIKQSKAAALGSALGSFVKGVKDVTGTVTSGGEKSGGKLSPISSNKIEEK